MLLETLEKHKRTIGWTLMDIKEIIPSLCMQIQMEGEQFKSIDQQRQLNQMMKEVVTARDY